MCTAKTAIALATAQRVVAGEAYAITAEEIDRLVIVARTGIDAACG